MRDNYVHLAELRLNWANDCIDRLEIMVETFLSGKPSEMIVSTKREGEKARLIYTLRIYHQPPPTIRFAVGDIVHNLRSTLDNLTWGIGQIYKGHKDLSLEFHNEKRTFLDCYAPKISGFPKPIYEWIESVQPYHKRGYIKSFYVLHQLWNRDKHRTPTIVCTAGVTNDLGYVGNDPFSVEMYFNRHSSGQKDQQKIVEAIIPWERRHDFKPEFTPLIAFDELGPVGLDPLKRPRSIVPYFRAVQTYMVDEVIPKFKPYLRRQ